MMRTLSLVVVFIVMGLVLSSKTERAVLQPCESGQYTRSGECCEECPPGEGVVQPCGASQTVCSQCMDSESYSENYSLTEECLPCTQCKGLMRMQTPCTDSNDAICVCNYGYFFNDMSLRCEPCTVCPSGQGVLSHCEYSHDTVCEECLDDTYSDRDSSLDPCLPCTVCDEGIEVEMSPCSPLQDSVCHNPFLPTYSSPTSDTPSFSTMLADFLPDGSISPSPGEETTTPNPSTPRFLGNPLNENLIPIYCSILAAVVVGLVVYIVFKRWISCKQNKQAANNRAAATANQTPTPEGEKLHSDSGISVDSQSLQEQLAQAQMQGQAAQSPDQIVVRVDGGSQPDSPPPQV